MLLPGSKYCGGFAHKNLRRSWARSLNSPRRFSSASTIGARLNDIADLAVVFGVELCANASNRDADRS